MRSWRYFSSSSSSSFENRTCIKKSDDLVSAFQRRLSRRSLGYPDTVDDFKGVCVAFFIQSEKFSPFVFQQLHLI